MNRRGIDRALSGEAFLTTVTDVIGFLIFHRIELTAKLDF
jgi:Mg/Co/Ni transporter MgtE